MSERKETQFICISCPVGCMLTVKEEDGEVKVSGNSCARGIPYGKQEFADPRRMVTSLIPVSGGARPLVPVKTKEPVPKRSIPEVLGAIQSMRVRGPVRIGQVLIEDAAGTGVPIVATRDA